MLRLLPVPILPLSILILSFVIMTGSVIAADDSSHKSSTVNPDNSYQSLAELEWKYRLILARGSDGGIVTMFEKYTEAIDDRKIAWFVLIQNSLHSNILNSITPAMAAEVTRYLEAYHDNDMVLIGYDGEVKAVDTVLSIVNFFEEIDRMPIRQYEMAND